MANAVAGCTMIHGSKSQAASEPELEKKPDVWRLVGSWRSSGILKVKVKVWWEWKFVVSRKSSSKKGRKNYKFAKATLVLGARRQGQQKEGWEERTSFGLDLISTRSQGRLYRRTKRSTCVPPWCFPTMQLVCLGFVISLLLLILEFCYFKFMEKKEAIKEPEKEK